MPLFLFYFFCSHRWERKGCPMTKTTGEIAARAAVDMILDSIGKSEREKRENVEMSTYLLKEYSKKEYNKAVW